ncbi:MAG: DUF3299 domain-containing protein [Alphaproteobacteria bacterium]
MKKILVVFLMIILPLGALAKQSRLLEWEDLVPLDLRARALEIQEKIYNYNPHDGTDPAAMSQVKMDDVVKELDGEYVKITGFIVPLEFDTEYVNEFLLAPYMGACIHVPPPPANQIIFVKSKKKVKIDDIYYPFTFEGTLSTQNSDTMLAQTAYSLNADDYKVENEDEIWEDEIIEEVIPD